MKLKKEITIRNFVKKGEEIKDGDIVEFIDEGKIIEGQYGEQYVFGIRLPNGEIRNVGVNLTSRNKLIDAYGVETKEWIGKKARVWLNRESVQGRFRLVLYLTAPHQNLLNENEDESYQEIQAELDKMSPNA